MAEKVSIIVELKDKASSSLKKIGAGLVTIAKAPFKAINAGLVSIAKSPFKAINAGFSKIKKSLTGIGALLTAGAIIGGLKKSNELWVEQNRVLKQTEAVLKSTGNASGLTAEEINKMAGELQKVTNFGDEVTQSGQNLLLTFTKIGKDVFPQATETMLNMSQSMGQDVKSSAIQLGKALNDPITGISALSRVGVQLTQQQEDQIRVFQESGDIVSAQKVILKELEVQFGGSARAAADAGIQMGNAIGDVGEVIGKEFKPIWDGLARAITDFANSDSIRVIAENIGKVIQFILDNLSSLKKAFALTKKVILITFDELKVGIKLFALSVEEIIKRPFQFETYKKIFTALVDKIADIATRAIQLSKDLITKGIGAIKEFREKLFKDEKQSQVDFEQEVAIIKKESKDNQIKIENDYQAKLDSIEKDEISRKKTLELNKTNIQKTESDKRNEIVNSESEKTITIFDKISAKAKEKSTEIQDDWAKKFANLAANIQAFMADPVMGILSAIMDKANDVMNALEQVMTGTDIEAQADMQMRRAKQSRQRIERKISRGQMTQEQASEELLSIEDDLLLELERLREKAIADSKFRISDALDPIGAGLRVATAEASKDKLNRLIGDTRSNVRKREQTFLEFSNGGIVPGTSYHGDKVPILANSKELILNSKQQSNIGEALYRLANTKNINNSLKLDNISSKNISNRNVEKTMRNNSSSSNMLHDQSGVINRLERIEKALMQPQTMRFSNSDALVRGVVQREKQMLRTGELSSRG